MIYKITGDHPKITEYHSRTNFAVIYSLIIKMMHQKNFLVSLLNFVWMFRKNLKKLDDFVIIVISKAQVYISLLIHRRLNML